jgi:ATP-binding cassette subfamily F protein uup
MDKLVEHIFIFKGQGEIIDFNGTYTMWKNQEQIQRKSGDQTSSNEDIAIVDQSNSTDPDSSKRKLSYKEKMEMQTIEKRLKQLEKRKSEIERAFLDGTLNSEDIQKMSRELGTIGNEIEESEIRWLELSEFE